MTGGFALVAVAGWHYDATPGVMNVSSSTRTGGGLRGRTGRGKATPEDGFKGITRYDPVSDRGTRWQGAAMGR
jgi:hypothetical protein